jgi:hypothetical protein
MPAETSGLLPPAELNESLYNLDADESAFYKQQTGITDDGELKEHIVAVQRDAYAIHPYPCIHRFAFTQCVGLLHHTLAYLSPEYRLKISRLPAYPQVLELGRTRAHPILLDIGCCFGNDLRKAVADGFPRAGCIGSDLRPEFWQAGHRLFRDDPASLAIPFVDGDAFDPAFLTPDAPFVAAPTTTLDLAPLTAGGTLNPLRGRVSVVHASSFFHLFDEEQQAYLARALAPLLSQEPGSMLLGSHGGLPSKGHRSGSRGRGMFCHGPESWAELWESVFGKDKVKVQSRLVQRERQDAPERGQWYLLEWSVTRL